MPAASDASLKAAAHARSAHCWNLTIQKCKMGTLPTIKWHTLKSVCQKLLQSQVEKIEAFNTKCKDNYIHLKSFKDI